MIQLSGCHLWTDVLEIGYTAQLNQNDVTRDVYTSARCVTCVDG